MAKYLDNTGVQYLWNKIKSYVDSKVVNGITFSTSEQWTGDYWIDGKKIYQRTWSLGAQSGNNTATLSLSNINNIWFDMANSFYVETGSNNAGNRWPINGNFGDSNANGYAVSGRGPYYVPSSKKLFWNVPKSGCSSAYITFRYTKTTE